MIWSVGCSDGPPGADSFRAAPVRRLHEEDQRDLLRPRHALSTSLGLEKEELISKWRAVAIVICEVHARTCAHTNDFSAGCKKKYFFFLSAREAAKERARILIVIYRDAEGFSQNDKVSSLG